MNAYFRARSASLVLLSVGLCWGLPFSGFGQATSVVEASVAPAVETTEFQRVARAHSASQVWRSLGGMVLVLGVLFAASVYLKKRAGLRGLGKQRRIQVVERLAVDARRCLLLVKVEQRALLLGLSPQGISALAEWVADADKTEPVTASDREGIPL